MQSTVLVAKSTPEPLRDAPATDPDDALRLAIKAAVDAGDLGRAKALLDVLAASPRPAPVVSLVRRP